MKRDTIITESEYLKAKLIVDQYELNEYEERQREADEEISFDDE